MKRKNNGFSGCGASLHQTRPARIVVKVGTRLLTHTNGKLNLGYIERLTRDLADLHHQDKEIILVSSGAIGAGMGRLNMTRRPTSIPEKQAAAAVGQGLLLQIYEKLFAEYGLIVAQILLTRSDLISRRRYLNACNTLHTLLRWGVLPIINENDSISVEEIRFGDNDRLSALVAGLSEADLLILLTTVEGFFSGNPATDLEAKLIPIVDEITPALRRWAGDSGDELATGGMITKLQAAEIATHSGIGMFIADGRIPGILNQIVSGERSGTFFRPQARYLNRRKRWIAFGRVVQGSVVVDDGARDALRKDGKSLLPVGVTALKGEFKTGDLIAVFDREGCEIGRGLTNFSSAEIALIKKQCSSEIAALIGRPADPEVIHRDNLVIY